MTTQRVLRFYKPYGVLTKFTDDEGRSTLSEYVDVPGVYAAGRLDKDSEGLLLLTNDNNLNHQLTDPKFKHPRTYLVQVEHVPDEEALQKLRQGVVIKGKKTRPAKVKLLAEAPVLPERDPPVRFRKTVPTAFIELTLTEGRNRQVRRMTAAVGHPTLRLIRTHIGPINLDGLGIGEWQDLSLNEVQALLKSIQQQRKS